MSGEALHVVLLAGELQAGGDEAALGLAARLSAAGVRVRVVCQSRGPSRVSEIPIIHAPGLGRSWIRPWSVRSVGYMGGLERPDLIHALEPAAAEAALALAEHWKLPYVLTIHELPAPVLRLRVSRRWCRRILTTGSDLAHELIHQLDIPEAWILVIPPGIAPAAERHRILGPERVPVIGTVGPLGQGAGLETFLDGARQLVDAGIDAELVVAGQDHDEPDVRRLAAYLDLAERVTFVDDRGDTSDFWRALDIYCQPARVPCAGRALRAALAHGIPAIVSQVAGLRTWIIPGETGLLVPPGDADALAAAVRGLLADPEHARRLGDAARTWIARHCDPARETESLVSVYREAIGLGESAPAPKRLRRDAATPQ